jgi:membrane protease YdiL (CAAX protease family)
MMCAAFGIFHSILRCPSGARETSGITAFLKKVALFTLFGRAAGIILGMVYRTSRGETLFPIQSNRFLPVACIVGAAEELLCRGFIQGESRKTGFGGETILASLSHAAYKCAIFTPAAFQSGGDLHFLEVATFLGGFPLGGFREFSGNVLQPAAAHVFFDLIGYGGYPRAPWRVWS